MGLDLPESETVVAETGHDDEFDQLIKKFVADCIAHYKSGPEAACEAAMPSGVTADHACTLVHSLCRGVILYINDTYPLEFYSCMQAFRGILHDLYDGAEPATVQ